MSTKEWMEARIRYGIITYTEADRERQVALRDSYSLACVQATLDGNHHAAWDAAKSFARADVKLERINSQLHR